MNQLFGCTRLLALTFVAASIACSAGGDSPGSNGGGSGGGGPSGSGGGGNFGGGAPAPDGGIVLDPGGGDPNDDRDLPVREKVCDANGENCTCLRLALLGTLDSAADRADTKPFVDWLNGNSDGTATVTMVTTKPTLDAAFLANYDILVVANVNGWSFSDAEKQAVATWSRETGGGIIALTGFVSTAAEPPATSQLIEFSGIGFEAPTTAENGAMTPVYYEGGSVNVKECLGWSGNNDPKDTTVIEFTPQSGDMAKLTNELSYVGAFVGWSVKAPEGATVVATDPVSSNPIAVALQVEGKGRVFAFGDEWVIFANQWEPIGTPYNTTRDENNKCWVPASGDAEGFFHSVKTLYQTKQFWYNAINWVAPPNECNFVVKDPDVVVE